MATLTPPPPPPPGGLWRARPPWQEELLLLKWDASKFNVAKWRAVTSAPLRPLQSHADGTLRDPARVPAPAADQRSVPLPVLVDEAQSWVSARGRQRWGRCVSGTPDGGGTSRSCQTAAAVTRRSSANPLVTLQFFYSESERQTFPSLCFEKCVFLIFCCFFSALWTQELVAAPSVVALWRKKVVYF